MASVISITNLTKGTCPHVPFVLYKDAVLGMKYELSVVICGPTKMRSLNKMYRNIDKPTDILSFPLSKNSGEIFLCLSKSKKEAKKFDRSYENFLHFLIIHGLVHLKGYDHGPKMEKIEQKFRSRFNI